MRAYAQHKLLSLSHADRVFHGLRSVSSLDFLKSGVPGVQHVDVASGRERELRERPQVVLSGKNAFFCTYSLFFFSSPVFCTIFRKYDSSRTRRQICQNARNGE